MMHFLIFTLLLTLTPFTKGDILCHQCFAYDDENPNCVQLQDAASPGRCEPGTTMCYINKVNKRVYERGCLSEIYTYHWRRCHLERDINCFVCVGSGCNYIDIESKNPSQQFCLQCDNDRDCGYAMFAERCNSIDSIWGPPGCVTQFSPSGKQLTKKGCVNMINFGPGVDHRTYSCIGPTCNFIKKDFLMRCVVFSGKWINFEYGKKIKNCFTDSVLISIIPGCFIDRKGSGRYVTFGCNTRRLPDEIVHCINKKDCQICNDDMCNNKTGLFMNTCMINPWMFENCPRLDSMCYVYQRKDQFMGWGCVNGTTPGLYHPETLMCSNEKMGRVNCAPVEDIHLYRGCYECDGPLCDDVIVNLGFTARTICPLGISQCYSSRRADGRTFRGCYQSRGSSPGERVCQDAVGACKICSSNYCNYEQLVTLSGQCYKSNWKRADRHETTLRLADCTGLAFFGSRDRYCYIAASSRLLMRMGCISELVAGVDSSYAITTGGTSVAWLYGNSCYKCVSNYEGFCLDVTYVKQQKCKGLHRFPARGCYTLIDRRNKRVERGCVTEVTEFMLRLCELPIFMGKCHICQDNGCNDMRVEDL